MLDTHRRRRPLRVVAYSLLATGAGVLMVDPTRSLEGQAIWTRWVWSAFLLGGTLLAIYGSARDRYLAEFIGLPLLMTSLTVFVILLGAAHTTGSIAFACFLGSLVIVMCSRWLDIWRLVGAATRAERRRT